MNRATVLLLCLLACTIALGHAGTARHLAGACAKTSEYEYYNKFYFIKSVDITGQGFTSCCKK